MNREGETERDRAAQRMVQDIVMRQRPGENPDLLRPSPPSGIVGPSRRFRDGWERIFGSQRHE